MTKSGHKFKFKIKQYIPKQLLMLIVTSGWRKQKIQIATYVKN